MVSGLPFAGVMLNGSIVGGVFTGATNAASIRLVARATDPTDLIEGDIWFNTTANTFRGYDGTGVVDFH